MELNKTAKILIASGITLLTGALFFGRKAKANSLNQYTVSANGNSSQSPVIITTHDQVYDYKYENGIWYTRKKGSANWINMQQALNPENYQLAISRLQKYVQS
jgi:hypothetical protein